MLSISSNISNEIVINKSRFITFLYRVDSLNDISKYIDDLSLRYKDSTHICYAYILDNIKRFSDDGEPGGTAGMPILNVLENKNLNHILCCVVRYFGGIKLGAGGLVRAYSNSSSKILDLANIIELTPGKLCSISFKYDDTKIIDKLLSDCNIINKEYNDYVTYLFKSDFEFINTLSKYDVKIIEDCYIEKEN
ncbi:MAG: IMPACT family protein [Bacilli bacterium]